MKRFLLLTTAIIGLALTPALAQVGAAGGGQGQQFDGAIDKLFGSNQAYTATLEIQTKGNNGDDVIMSGKMNFDTGKARFEMNISDMKGPQMTPGFIQQMKSMGTDVAISISRPDLKLAYIVYPGLNSYAEMTSQQTSASLSPDDYKVETAEAGKEAVDGHDCVKNKATVTDKDGNKHEYTVWNATNLKNFPVKIEAAEGGHPTTMLYKNVSFTKSAASLFEPPAGLTKYDNLQTMLQTEMMKKLGGGGGPPAQQ